MVSFEQTVADQLCRINQSLIDIKKSLGQQDTQKGVYNSWTGLKVGKSWFLERLVTLSGTTMTINLDLLDLIRSFQKREVLPWAFQLNRIEQIFNDTTARTYSIRIYSNPAFSEYIEINASTGNTRTNSIVQAGIEYKYPAEFRIQLYYSNFTAGKTVRIRIQVDEL